jgi:hypothetical protein
MIMDFLGHLFLVFEGFDLRISSNYGGSSKALVGIKECVHTIPTQITGLIVQLLFSMYLESMGTCPGLVVHY